MTEPHFIEAGDADDTPLPLPIFVTRKDQSHNEVMRAILKEEAASAELSTLERLLDH